MKNTLTLFFVLVFNVIFGQNWVDTTFNISTEMDVVYGLATGFAGREDTLKLDMSYPTNDLLSECGRPLMVIVHGGAWIEGDKNQGYPIRLRQDFAKRGYVTASVNYRLGQFNTNQNINCNVPGWNCFNMTDSSEWYRANYRGIQDVNGAIRFLINHSDDYQIDPNHVFVVGESAGGFVAMGVGFIDDASEVMDSLVGAYPDAPPPNALYENACIQTYGMADNISSMDLSRPALGSHQGTLNFPLLTDFKIRAVGNIYGGAFNNIFESFDEPPPGLYLYHQPCDLIVPFNYSRLLSGYVNCLSQFPTFCGGIPNRPFAYGSRGIKNLIDTMVSNSIPTSEYYFDNSGNNYNCFQQVDPNFGCHAIDNYWLRTTNMATFFSSYIDSCVINSVIIVNPIQGTIVNTIYPNPSKDLLRIKFNESVNEVKVEIVNILGEASGAFNFLNLTETEIDISRLSAGVYHIVFLYDDAREVRSFVKL